MPRPPSHTAGFAAYIKLGLREDTPMPIHNWDSPFWRLLHEPSEPVALKDIFDNLKHFAICGGRYILAKSIPVSGRWSSVSVSFLMALAWVLGLLCSLQTWALAQKGFYQLWPVWHMDYEEKPIRACLKTLCLISIPLLLAMATVVAANSYVFASKP